MPETLPTPTILLVTGSWMTKIHGETVRLYFDQAGYRYRYMRLPSVGIQQPRATHQDDVEGLFRQLLAETGNGRDVYLVLHSHAGTPGQDAVNKFLSSADTTEKQQSQLIRVIFLAAQIENFGQEISKPYYESIFRVQDGYAYLNDPARYLFNDLSSFEAQPFVEALRPWTLLPVEPGMSQTSGELSAGNVKSSDVGSQRWKKVPCTYVVCLRD